MSLVMRNNLKTIEFEALTANTAKAITWDNSDEHSIVVVTNTGLSATDLTVKAGNGIQGVNDVTYTVPANSTNIIKLESGRFKNVSGDNKGKIVVISTGTPSVGIAALV